MSSAITIAVCCASLYIYIYTTTTTTEEKINAGADELVHRQKRAVGERGSSRTGTLAVAAHPSCPLAVRFGRHLAVASQLRRRGPVATPAGPDGDPLASVAASPPLVNNVCGCLSTARLALSVRCSSLRSALACSATIDSARVAPCLSVHTPQISLNFQINVPTPENFNFNFPCKLKISTLNCLFQPQRSNFEY